MITNMMSIPTLAVWVALFTVASTSLLHDKRIVNGEESEPFSHPYIVSLQLHCTKYPEFCEKTDRGWKHDCGGVVLDSNWVLTAAHCVENTEDGTDFPKDALRLKFGEHSLEEDTNYESSRNVQTYIKHHAWNRTELYANDIALIRLDTPVELGDHIQAATLAQDDSDFVYETCLLAGWGYTEEGVLPDVLREVNKTYIPDELCAHMLIKDDLREMNDAINELRGHLETKICAFDISPGPQGQGSACFGDSGGPMFCGKDQNTVVGILSTVTLEPNPCSWLSLYTRVSKYITWMEAIRGYVDSLYQVKC